MKFTKTYVLAAKNNPLPKSSSLVNIKTRDNCDKYKTANVRNEPIDTKIFLVFNSPILSSLKNHSMIELNKAKYKKENKTS